VFICAYYYFNNIQRSNASSIITSTSGNTKSNQIDPNNHEEPRTLMIILAVAGPYRHLEAQLAFFSLNTDVIVLSVADYDTLCKHTSIAMVSYMNKE